MKSVVFITNSLHILMSYFEHVGCKATPQGQDTFGFDDLFKAVHCPSKVDIDTSTVWQKRTLRLKYEKI